MRISDWSSDVCSSDLHIKLLFLVRTEECGQELRRDTREHSGAATQPGPSGRGRDTTAEKTRHLAGAAIDQTEHRLVACFARPFEQAERVGNESLPDLLARPQRNQPTPDLAGRLLLHIAAAPVAQLTRPPPPII